MNNVALNEKATAILHVRGEIVSLLRMRAETAKNGIQFASTQKQQACLAAIANAFYQTADNIESAKIE